MPSNNPNVLKNLKPFKPGQSGNPKGRPKKAPMPDLEGLLAEVLGAEKDQMSALEAILRKLRTMAIQGNLRAAEILLDRAYGRPKQSHDINGLEPPDINMFVVVPDNHLLHGGTPQRDFTQVEILPSKKSE